MFHALHQSSCDDDDDGLTVCGNHFRRVRNVDMKRDYAFVDFSDPRDADDARHYLDGRDIDGRRITVEFAKGIPRGPGGVREYGGRGPIPGTGRCFNCGVDGHWARDCRAGDWKNKCYRCGERGHIERNCPSSPKKPSSRSYSRSPSPRRGRSRDRSLSRSLFSRSRSPSRRRERNIRSPNRKSPKPKRITTSPSKTSKRSPTPDNTPPKPLEQEHAYDSDSPKKNNQSPSPIKEERMEPEHEDGYIDSPDDNKLNEDGLKENTESLNEEDVAKAPEEEDGYIIDNIPKENKRSPSPGEDMKEEDHEEGYVENPKEMDDDGGVDGQSPNRSPGVEDGGNTVGPPPGNESP